MTVTPGGAEKVVSTDDRKERARPRGVQALTSSSRQIPTGGQKCRQQCPRIRCTFDGEFTHFCSTTTPASTYKTEELGRKR
ncbi:hypothetical protein PoB_006495000 [Plakobranchus ocellatus]|uniref:Uncharacterized protein n=1 Tax=Plakobranchus ocellatus TaxID=259542 RepID=A0AAV4D396_9GAST|nr:hypothetical protein PoB_006495000 [Plakobranchus ocellatus]